MEVERMERKRERVSVWQPTRITNGVVEGRAGGETERGMEVGVSRDMRKIGRAEGAGFFLRHLFGSRRNEQTNIRTI